MFPAVPTAHHPVREVTSTTLTLTSTITTFSTSYITLKEEPGSIAPTAAGSFHGTILSLTELLTTTLTYVSVKAFTVPDSTPTSPGPHSGATESLTVVQPDILLSQSASTTITSHSQNFSVNTNFPTIPESSSSTAKALPPPSATAPSLTPSSVSRVPSTDVNQLPNSDPSHGAGASGVQPPASNAKLSRVLPAVLLPVAFLAILAYFAFKKLRRKSQKSSTMPIPFTTLSSTTSSRSLSGNKLVTKQVGTEDGTGTLLKPISGRSEELPLIPECNDVGTHDHDDGENGLESQYPRQSGEINTREPEGAVVPAIRAEILELRVRLANVEAQAVTLPPPEYASEGGQ